MPAYILTGAPGSGKTAILRKLEIDGHDVVEEAATDVIALQQALGRPEPWREPGFPDRVLDLQRKRQLAAEADTRGVVFFDRSPVCTLALCRYLDLAAPRDLLEEIERMLAERWYELTYREVGFDLFEVPAAPLPVRVVAVQEVVDRLGRLP